MERQKNRVRRKQGRKEEGKMEEQKENSTDYMEEQREGRIKEVINRRKEELKK